MFPILLFLVSTVVFILWITHVISFPVILIYTCAVLVLLWVANALEGRASSAKRKRIMQAREEGQTRRSSQREKEK